VNSDNVVLTVYDGFGAVASDKTLTPANAGATDNPKVAVQKLVVVLDTAVFIVVIEAVGLLAAGALVLEVGDGIA